MGDAEAFCNGGANILFFNGAAGNVSFIRKTLRAPAEYLVIERQAERKSEYFAGEIFAMTGAVECHNITASNLGSPLRFQLKKRPCTAYPVDMRVKISSGVLNDMIYKFL